MKTRTRTRELSLCRPGGSSVTQTGARKPAGEGTNVPPGPGRTTTLESRRPTGESARRRVWQGRWEKAPRSTHHLRRGPQPLPIPARLPLRVFLRPHFRRSALSHCARLGADCAPALALRRAHRKRAPRRAPPRGAPPTLRPRLPAWPRLRAWPRLACPVRCPSPLPPDVGPRVWTPGAPLSAGGLLASRIAGSLARGGQARVSYQSSACSFSLRASTLLWFPSLLWALNARERRGSPDLRTRRGTRSRRSGTAAFPALGASALPQGAHRLLPGGVKAPRPRSALSVFLIIRSD